MRKLPKLILRAFILIFFSPILLLAQSNAGSAELGMLSKNWPCRDARNSENENGLRELRKAVLWNTFGVETSCLREYFADSRLVSFELHLINEVCQRKNNCGEYEVLHGISTEEYNRKLIEKDAVLIEKLNNYFKAPAELINNNLKSQVECLVSPGLESNLSTDAAKVVINIIKPLFPNCKVVWNPVDSNPDARPIGKSIFEMHGSGPRLSPPCNANLDGTDISFPERPAIIPNLIDSRDIKAYIKNYKSCQNVFLWISEFNAITEGEFIDPRQRTAFPTLKTFNLVNSLLAPKKSTRSPKR